MTAITVEEPNRRKSPESQAGKLANAIYQGLKPFARSFYNRDNLIENRLKQSILADQPVQILGFWGIGGKGYVDKNDERLLTQYEAIHETIRTLYLQAADMQLILANAHGRFNGYQGFDGYLGAIASEASQRDIASVSLDDLYKEWDIQLPDSTKPIDRQSHDWIEFAVGLEREHEAENRHDRGNRAFMQLVESAEKHSRVGIDPEEAAFHYWMMRKQERKPLSRSFPNGILLVNGSEGLGRVTLPLDMPHMYSQIGPVWFQHD